MTADITSIVSAIAAKAKARGFAPDEPVREPDDDIIDDGAWRGLGVGRRVVSVLDVMRDTKAIRAVSDWLDETSVADPWALVLSGPPGIGKTVAAAYWLSQMSPRPIITHVKGDRVVAPPWRTAFELARLGAFDGSFAALCSHAGPIVIDDLGTEYLEARGWTSSAVDGLIDARYADYRPTCITTNLTALEFARRYGERVMERLREGGVYVEIRSESMRSSHG